jgi:hypothetical protein
MVPVMSLWLPILVSAIFVFISSYIMHSVLPYHKSDYRGLPDEQKIMDFLRGFNLTPGEYHFPRPQSMKDMGSPEFREKFAKGPVAMMTVLPNASMGMARNLIQWFVYSLVVGIFAAYVAGRALEPGAYYLSVFRFVGTTAFLGYGLALAQESIWYGKPWSTTAKNLFDALVYALLTAGTFGWLWPE